MEVQDKGSRLIALACEPKAGERIIDLCAGAGGKSLALAAAAPDARILAADSNKGRLSKLPPRLSALGHPSKLFCSVRPKELEELGAWRGQAEFGFS